MRLHLFAVVSALLLALTSAQITQIINGATSIFGVITSGAGGLVSTITSGAASVATVITSEGGSIATVVTSVGGGGLGLLSTPASPHKVEYQSEPMC